MVARPSDVPESGELATPPTTAPVTSTVAQALAAEGIPILLAGGGNGTITPGRHIVYKKETPLNNLWLAMLERMNVKVPSLGDSTGVLSGLS